MAVINFNGLGSGIDFSQLTDSIIAERSRPITQSQNKSAGFNKRIEALRSLNATLTSLTAATEALKSPTLGDNRSALSSDNAIASGTATSGAIVGSINLSVTRVATGLSQASRSFASTSTPVLTGGATGATFELRLGGASTGTAVTIDASNNSLEGLRSAINAAGAGVTASIVDVTGAGSYQLILTSKDTGAAGRVELVETTATGTLADLTVRSLNPPGAIADFSTLDAAFNINGLGITRPSNTVSDAVTGVTLTLKKAGDAVVSVSGSTEVSGKIQTFVVAYNQVQDFILSQYKVDERGRPQGPLAGDATLRAVQQQLREAVGANSTGNGGTLTNLAELGIGRDTNGKLTLDSAVLGERLKTSPTDVKALLSGATASDTGIANSIYNVYQGLSDSVTGLVQGAITGYQSSVASIDKLVTAQLDRLNQLRQSLVKQFAAADAAIGQLNGQGTSLESVIKSLQPRH